MAAPRDRTAFLATNEIRLLVASWCRQEALTREAIAKRLERPSGGVSAPDTMLRRGALVPDGLDRTSDSVRPAQLLRLNPEWEDALEEALRRRRPTVLPPNTELLFIPLTATEDACSVLANGVTDVAWGVRLSGEQLGLVLGPTPDQSGAATARVASVLGRAGVSPLRVRLEVLMGPTELRDWARKVSPHRRAPRLPDGDDAN
jgi:hypothetical protein